MPVKKTKSTISPAAGRGVVRRVRRKRSGQRQPGQRQTNSAKPIGTLYTVALKPKYGAEVYMRLSGKNNDLDLQNHGFAKLYNDLLSSLIIAAKLFDHKEPVAETLHTMMGYPFAINYVLRKIKEVIPAGYKFNVEYMPSLIQFEFAVFSVFESEETFCCIDIKQTVTKVKKHNKKLHDHFIVFLATLYRVSLVKFWFCEEYPLDWLAEDIHNMDEEESEVIAKAQDCIIEYTRGMAKQYEGLIRTSKFSTYKDLLVANAKFNQSHPIVKIIKKACEVLGDDYSIDSFVYEHATNDPYGDAGLRFYNQFYVAWDSEDTHFDLYSEYINCDANEGLFPPCIHAFINKNTRQDLQDWFFKGTGWPAAYVQFNTFYNQQQAKYER